MTDEIIKALNEKFSQEEVNIFLERYGIFTHEPRTLSSVAEDHGLTREDVRKLEGKMFNFLKRKFAGRKEELNSYFTGLRV